MNGISGVPFTYISCVSVDSATLGSGIENALKCLREDILHLVIQNPAILQQPNSQIKIGN